MRPLTTHRLPRLAAVLAAGLLLGACGGSGGANQEDVQEDVKSQLLENGYIAEEGAEPIEVTDEQATDISVCVGAGLFDTENFTEDERNEVTNPGDGTPPPDDLVTRFDDLVTSCAGDALSSGPSAPSDEDDS